METHVEHMDGGLVKLTVSVPAAEVDAAIDEAYREVGGRLRIPGFRKGKVPRPVIDTHVGRDVILAQAQEALVDRTYPRAIDETGLRPIDAPDTGDLDQLVSGEPFTYSAEILVRPELTLSSLDDLVVAAGPVATTEREVDAQLDYYRERFATLETADRPVEPGDFVQLSFVGTVDGEPYEGNTVDRYLYETQRGLMPTEFDEALLGAKAGDRVVAEFTIPDTSSDPDFVGKTARFEIAVHEVKAKVLPDLDDALATSVGGFDTLEELRDDIRKKLDESKAAGRKKRIELLALELLTSRLEGEVPEVLVNNRAASMTRDFFESLDSQQLTLEDYVNATGVSPEQIQADIQEQARKRVREELALEALFRAKNMEITPEDMDKAFLDLAGGDQNEVATLRANLTDAGATPIVRESLMHQRALEWLLDNVIVTEDEPSVGETADTEVAPKKKRAAKKKAAPAKEE
ncbi:MAG: trigger factor [Coriobacteriales bacterium]|nr:trigger factor [Actinomycetes bacterium]